MLICRAIPNFADRENENALQQISTLDIVVPCYNPKEGWQIDLLNNFRDYLDASSLHYVKLILINDGSTSGVQPAHFEYLKANLQDIQIISYPENHGKGYALRQGVRQSRADALIFTDIDFPYTLESMIAVEKSLLNNAGVVLGYRDQTYYESVPWFRKVLSKSLRWTIKTLLRLPTNDSQCGLKGFDRKGMEVFLDTSIDRFLFDLEFLVLANKRKNKINLVNVQLKEGIEFSSVSLKIVISELFNFLRIFLNV